MKSYCFWQSQLFPVPLNFDVWWSLTVSDNHNFSPCLLILTLWWSLTVFENHHFFLSFFNFNFFNFLEIFACLKDDSQVDLLCCLELSVDFFSLENLQTIPAASESVHERVQPGRYPPTVPAHEGWVDIRQFLYDTNWGRQLPPSQRKQLNMATCGCDPSHESHPWLMPPHTCPSIYKLITFILLYVCILGGLGWIDGAKFFHFCPLFAVTCILTDVDVMCAIKDTTSCSKPDQYDLVMLQLWLELYVNLRCWVFTHGRAPKKNTSHGIELLPQDTTHVIQRPCYQRGISPNQDPTGNWTTRRPPYHCKETQTAMVWSCLSFIRSGQNHLARHSERGKKTRQTEEEVGGQHQGMDRPGVCEVSEGSWEQGKMEKTGFEIIGGAPTALAVKG